METVEQVRAVLADCHRVALVVHNMARAPPPTASMHVPGVTAPPGRQEPSQGPPWPVWRLSGAGAGGCRSTTPLSRAAASDRRDAAQAFPRLIIMLRRPGYGPPHDHQPSGREVRQARSTTHLATPSWRTWRRECPLAPPHPTALMPKGEASSSP